jgi:hypothetical protein
MNNTARKTCPTAILALTNPTWTGLGFNLGLHSERQMTDYLNHGTAITSTKKSFCYI